LGGCLPASPEDTTDLDIVFTTYGDEYPGWIFIMDREEIRNFPSG